MGAHLAEQPLASERALNDRVILGLIGDFADRSTRLRAIRVCLRWHEVFLPSIYRLVFLQNFGSHWRPPDDWSEVDNRLSKWYALQYTWHIHWCFGPRDLDRDSIYPWVAVLRRHMRSLKTIQIEPGLRIRHAKIRRTPQVLERTDVAAILSPSNMNQEWTTRLGVQHIVLRIEPDQLFMLISYLARAGGALRGITKLEIVLYDEGHARHRSVGVS